jgi:hypothetical protein
MDEVARSIRVGSTPTEPHADWRRLGFALGGFVAGEGCFSVRTVRASSSTAPARKRFSFTVTVAARDSGLITELHHHLGGAGAVYRSNPRRSHWQPTVSLQITSMVDHLAATIPFAEQFLLPVGRKYDQYRSWRDDLQSYRRHLAERLAARPTRCRTPGCGRPIRARGLCRGCYWRATGN